MKQSCRQIRKALPLFYYGEVKPGQKEEIASHLETCAACRQEFETLRANLDGFGSRTRPEPDAEQWKRFWNKLEPELRNAKPSPVRERRIPGFGWNTVPVRLAFGTACVLTIGIYIGTLIRPSAPPVIVKNDPAQIQLVQDEARDYMQQAKIIMLGIVNSDEGKINLKLEQDASESLIQKTSALVIDLDKNKQYMLADLIRELDMILVQIANMENERDLPGIELIRSSADEQAILFKINMSEILLDSARPGPVKKTDPVNSSI